MSYFMANHRVVGSPLLFRQWIQDFEWVD